MMHLNNKEYEKIIESFLKGDWEAVLVKQSSLNDPYFLWPKPKKSDLYFIADSLRKLNMKSILSIGCGCGLLEWLLITACGNENIGLKVIGVEIDKNYWQSKYARRSFIDLVFPQDNIFTEIINIKNMALMFCYFNDIHAFQKYLDIYPGKCIIIIGPEKYGKYTEPSPFDENIPCEWELHKLREISATGDYITLYTKRKQNNLERD